ncbi:D-galactose/ D-glucose-binding protein [Anaerobiospirillum thomasii]|uniref:D-galactose/methyl-galactoside binding periplasmic protein MglB n=1 Tax=Anaerobiospirillum thomasii TaxID=179995 RepID=A0A2X0WW42_9GAMM|nr:galactose ABC transporter substrate-binding protein [Anaerobiospirillum thomasii]SPT68243.1 D-galactose/ D-glucose-binding protein [Anaerobiospirillum thomasii]SPT70712.1 D-galactose/ D-glucose-binding protein [Anaerobiospirillum thomasii]
MFNKAKFTAIAAGVMFAATMGAAQAADDVLIGSCIYKFDDTFMTGVRNNMEKAAADLKADIELVDSQNRQPMQNDQVDTFITKGVTALVINPVDRSAAGPLVDKAKGENLPIVFINREPDKSILDGFDKAWYVGAKAEESGTIGGQLIVDYFKAHPEADKNGDGVIQYILIKGEQGHQDATLRSEYCVKAMKDAGMKIEEIGADNANWDKVQGHDKMKNFITAKGIDAIEAVLCNNDDMALGAIEALKSEGYNTGKDPKKYIPVTGVDATAPALQAIAAGQMLGTSLNDAYNQGTAAVRIANQASKGEAVTDESIGYKITDGKYVWIPYVKVTQENYKDFMK